MTEAEGSLACTACGNLLPTRSGKGRKRRYCDARCRDAARRARVRSQRDDYSNVNDSLTSALRQDYLYTISTAPESADPLDVVAAARERAAAAADALQAAVDQARAAGHSWREIGDVLETTRQAAFQRFGRPVDPRTGTPMSARIVAGAPDRAVEIIGCIIEGRWEDARRDFDERMLEAVDATLVAAVWARTIGKVGRYERMGEPVAYQAADVTVIDVPLYFEAGEATVQTSLNQAGQVIGLFIRPAST